MQEPSNLTPSATCVLLLGATGNLGRRLIPALLTHSHQTVAIVRSTSKLYSILPPSLLPHPQLTIIQGDATNSEAIAQALRDHTCNAIINAAGNQVAPWQEPVLEKIMRAVTDAAVDVGRERGEPLRGWFIGGMGSLVYPGTGGYLIQD
jgi:uncharacterized protein YbjT (DUF2867 family)